jgi:hypothetical protein
VPILPKVTNICNLYILHFTFLFLFDHYSLVGQVFVIIMVQKNTKKNTRKNRLSYLQIFVKIC